MRLCKLSTMKNARLALALVGVAGLLSRTSLSGQAPLSDSQTALRSHLALQALDRYLETWNSRDPTRWAGSLHFPHIRPGPGAFELSQTPEQYAAGVDFEATLKTGWHHTEWTLRRVLQIGVEKVHVAGNWTRYTADGRPLAGSAITYIVTNQGGRWRVLSRFAAGAIGLDAGAAAENETAARRALDHYFTAWNSHDPDALAAALHYPHVRIAGGGVEVWNASADFHAGSEPGRQRTWFDTRLDRADVAQVSASGVNIAGVYSRRDREGQVVSRYEAVFLVVRRPDGWKVQAVSTMGS
jgi:hypothetical protein